MFAVRVPAAEKQSAIALSLRPGLRLKSWGIKQIIPHETAIIPEMDTEVDQLAELISQGFRKSKNSAIVIVAENPRTGGAMGLAERVKKEFPQYDARVTILGHIQRGGSPSAQDRILASRMGAMAIQAIMEGQRNVMIGIQNNELVYVPFSRAVRHNKSINRDYVNLVKILSM